jgi:hypothetical protein
MDHRAREVISAPIGQAINRMLCTSTAILFGGFCGLVFWAGWCGALFGDIARLRPDNEAHSLVLSLGDAMALMGAVIGLLCRIVILQQRKDSTTT